MEKRCGNCGWWGGKEYTAPFTSEKWKFGPCEYPMPVGWNIGVPDMWDYQGKGCPCWKEKE